MFLSSTGGDSQHDAQVVIVGAGLSGLVAAHTLTEAGVRCLLLDKGRSAGGRLATRRFTSGDRQAKGARSGLSARADHGAQFFTVRSPDFAELVHEWRRAGIVREWCQGFTAGGDGHPRYCAEAGMNTIAKFLAASADLETGVTVTRVVDAADGSFIVEAADGRRWTAPVVLLSAPVPQSLELLSAGGLVLDPSIAPALGSVSYARCLALMVVLDGPSAVPEPGGVQLGVSDDPLFSFVSDNHRKGISETVTLTLHTHDEPSVAMWDHDRETTRQVLLRGAQRWIGSATVTDSQLHGWRFARPLQGHPDPCVITSTDSGGLLGFIGDAFGGAKVEGAALSGLAAAQRLLGVEG
jgi:renalase